MMVNDCCREMDLMFTPTALVKISNKISLVDLVQFSTIN